MSVCVSVWVCVASKRKTIIEKEAGKIETKCEEWLPFQHALSPSIVTPSTIQ